MHVEVKRYNKKDAVELKHLIKMNFEEDSLSLLLDNANLQFAYSARWNKKLVGVMMAWKSTLHPHCTYCKILINPFYQNVDVKKTLLLKINELRSEDIPLQTSIWETAADLKSIYEKNGFSEVRRTYMPILKVADMKYIETPSKENAIIKTLSEITSNEFLYDKLVRIVKYNYEQTHLDNPIAELGLDKWKELMMSEDVILDGTYLYVDKGEREVLAYSFLHFSEEDDTFELGWCGSNNVNNIDLIPDLTKHQIDYANKENIKSIIGEFDTTDKSAMEVLRSLPFEPSPTWITYQKV